MKKLLALTVCFIFIGAIYSFAEPVKQNPWELGTEISHRKYKEPGVMEQKGIMYGLFWFLYLSKQLYVKSRRSA